MATILYISKILVHAITGREGLEGECWYNSTLSLASALYVGEWSTPLSGRFTPGKETPVPIVQEAGWAPGPVRTGGGNVASIGIRSPESPAHIELLDTLHYPVPHILKNYFAVLQTLRETKLSWYIPDITVTELSIFNPAETCSILLVY